MCRKLNRERALPTEGGALFFCRKKGVQGVSHCKRRVDTKAVLAIKEKCRKWSNGKTAKRSVASTANVYPLAWKHISACRGEPRTPRTPPQSVFRLARQKHSHGEQQPREPVLCATLERPKPQRKQSVFELVSATKKKHTEIQKSRAAKPGQSPLPLNFG